MALTSGSDDSQRIKSSSLTGGHYHIKIGRLKALPGKTNALRLGGTFGLSIRADWQATKTTVLQISLVFNGQISALPLEAASKRNTLSAPL